MKRHGIDTFEDLQDEGIERLVIRDDAIFVKIKTSDYTNFIQFLAEVNGGTPESVSFVIRTTDIKTGRRHPYFEHRRPTELAARAIHHFELAHDVNVLNFTWTKTFGPPNGPSDNYTAYTETLNRLQNGMTIEEARRQAVLATWTVQRIALPNGFSQIGEIQEEIRGKDSFDSPTEIHGTMLRSA